MTPSSQVRHVGNINDKVKVKVAYVIRPPPTHTHTHLSVPKMATVRDFLFIYIKSNVTRICPCGNYVYKWIIKLLFLVINTNIITIRVGVAQPV
jgi:hypothetical protein